MNIELLRHRGGNKSTLGLLGVDCDYRWYTLELPDKDNKKSVSCIPPGRYKLKYRKASESGKFKYDHIHVLGVPNRSYILFHVANYPHEIRGCIGVGLTQGKNFVGDSVKGFSNFMARVGNEIKKGNVYLNIKYL